MAGVRCLSDLHAPPIEPALATRIREAFDRGSEHGLLHLGAVEIGQVLPPVFAYWREFGGCFVTALCTRPDTDKRASSASKSMTASPAEIDFPCSCPDWAWMCKQVAAVLYGVGARFDKQPELLFQLRKLNEKDLIKEMGKGLPLSKKGPAKDKVLTNDSVSELFGLEIGVSTNEPVLKAAAAPKKTPKKTTRTRPVQQSHVNSPRRSRHRQSPRHADHQRAPSRQARSQQAPSRQAPSPRAQRRAT